jgi:preprotein translocase subunit YajC
MSNLMSILLMAPTEGQSNPYSGLIMMLLILVVFYFFMIRPQVKKQKELKNYRESLQKGDKVITTGGIYGKIADIKDQIVTVEIADQVKIKIDKSAILKDPTDISQQK